MATNDTPNQDAIIAHATNPEQANQAGAPGFNPAANSRGTVGSNYTPPAPLPPRVTPPTPPPTGNGTPIVPPVTPPVTDPATAYYKNLTPPPTEDQNYANLLGKAGDAISAINDSYKTELDSANAASAARVNAGGLAGSTAGGEIYTEAQKPIIDARNTALANEYQTIQTNAEALTQADNAQFASDFATAQTLKQNALAQGTASITTLADNGFDFNEASNPSSPNYQTYQNLLSQVGGDPNTVKYLAASALASKPENVVSTYYTSDGSGGTTVNQVTQDPVTGKIAHTNYNVPGFSIPQNWTQQKIGTNSQLLTSPDFSSDPSNPANWTFMGVDPTNNGAFTVVSADGTFVNGIKVDNTSPAGASAIQNANTQEQSAYASKVINDTATFSGVTDITQPMSDVIANANIGVQGVWNGIVKQEGGSPSGVINNPGNIAYAGQLGATKSSVPINDANGNPTGLYFASFDTKANGDTAGMTMVQRAADTGQTFQDFITSYKGLATPTQQTNSIPGMPQGITQDQTTKAQNYAKDIINGNLTSLTSVPKGIIRDATAAILANPQGSNGTTAYSPLAMTRFTRSANAIDTNLMTLPQYALTANAVPYLQKIDASIKIPGSVSDQDLLDAFTKLSTSGGVISDAQVKLITDGQSWSDVKDVLSKKLASGGVLSDAQRQQIQDIAKATFNQFKIGYQPVYNQAVKQFTDAGIPKPFWTMPDLNTLSELGGVTGDGTNNTSSSVPTEDDSQMTNAGFTANSDGSYSPPNDPSTKFIYSNGIWTH